MARSKYHVTPESGRIAITLNKRQLKELKKMTIEFEMSVEDILQIAVDAFIQRYQSTSCDQIDRDGIAALTR